MIEFRNFSIEDNERYKKHLRLCIQMPSNLSPLVLLNDKDRFNFKRGYAADLCWHKFTEDGKEFWTAPVGDWDEINWREVFNKHVPADTVFDNVPEYLVKLWQNNLGSEIKIEADRDNWDYILYIDRMEKLEGKQLKSIRQGRNSFEKNYDYTIEEITPKIFDELRAFQVSAEKNLQSRVDNVEEAEEDNAMLYFTLEHWEDFKNLFGFVIRVDSQIVAYSLDELIDETHSIGLFAKANYDFKGVNQFAYWYDAKINLERGILTQNIMEDVGEENLRFFKEHLLPLVMLKKFSVTYTPTSEAHGLNFSARHDGERLTVKLSGKLNTDAANAMKDKILSALDGAKDVTFDLSGLEYISSSGLRILVAALKKVRAGGGDMTVKNVGKQVREVLDMTGFAQIFNVEA